MASVTQIPVAEYLKSSYRPDREYIDGEVRERNVGKWEHARVQFLLGGWFGEHEVGWGVLGGIAQRVRVSPARVRVPDLVVVEPGPQPDVLTAPPLLVVEILSPDDTYSDTEERARDYSAMGVETVWIIDPRTRSGRMCVGAEWVGARRLVVAGTTIYVDLEELFGQLQSRAATAGE
jgi:Uma2 family endonuclease